MTVVKTDQVPDWRRAACRSAPPGLFITEGDEDDEPAYPPIETKRYCEACPIKPECLEFAMVQDLVGVWGGTTTYQRNQLKRKRSRSTCPGCGHDDAIVGHGSQELCLGCGYSWQTF